MWIARADDGQASVELVAVLPVLGVVALLAWQALIAGEAWWLAGAAAREAARAQALGQDPAAAARSVLPARLRGGVRVRRVAGQGPDGDGVVTVRVAVPSVVSGLRWGSVTVRARMEPQT
jgi:hypothetical protein